MCRILLAILIGLFCCGPTLTAVAQTRRVDSPEVLKQLLTLPAPVPRHAASPTATVRELGPEFFAPANPPADDAPIADLIAYWTRWIGGQNNSRLTDAVRQRLLDYCLADQNWLPSLLPLLPQTDSTREKVKEIYDKARPTEETETDFSQQLKDWLILNSTYFLDELMALAQKAKDNDKEGHVRNEEELQALAKLHWSGAEPLLRSLMATGQPRSSAVALSLFYRHAIDEKDLSGEERYRRELQAMAANRNLPAYARHTAIEAVSMSEWSGRDEWYLELFKDESLLNIREPDAPLSYSPFLRLFQSDPDKWIPVMARLVKSDDLNVRSTAASCLIIFHGEMARKDALLPLLPWLTNPSWVKEETNKRLVFIQSLAEVDLPESVPGLIAIADNSPLESAWDRAFAAKSLAKYKDPRAAPTLRRLLNKEKDQMLRSHIIEGLLACGGLSQAEQLEAVEAYASKIATEDGRVDAARMRAIDEEPLPIQLAIGQHLGAIKDVPESLVSAVIVRAESLASENPLLAKKMIAIAHEWQGSQVEVDILRRIANGSADATMITKILDHKSKLPETLRPEIQGLLAVSGAAQGIGAVLLDDALLAQEILTAKDETAQIGLLAGSRRLQTALPVTLVGPLLSSKNSLLALAAETYLLAEDSREARELLWQHHRDKAFITGWLETLDYPTDVYTEIRKTEAKLREELFKEDGPIEILALIPNTAEGPMVLRIYPNKAVFIEQEDSSRYHQRTVPKSELSSFKDFLTTNAILDRGPSNDWCYEACPSYEFLSVTKEKGRRVLSRSGFRDDALLDRFYELANGDGVETHYDLEREIKGLEVLYAGDDLSVSDVWRQGNELRVLVERVETEEEFEHRTANFERELEDEEPATRLERRRHEAEKDNARFSWRVFANNQLGAVTTQPDLYPVFDGARFITDDEDAWEPIAGYSEHIQVLTPDSIIIAQDFGGLWKQVAGAKPVQISDDGVYMKPILSRDRKWVVLAKTDENWRSPNYIVRYNLQTGREFRVNLEPADEFEPVALVASHNKVLLHRVKDPYMSVERDGIGPDRPEYYLLDPATGATRLVTGEFEPLRQKGPRPLQRTEKPDEFWVALPDNTKNRTRIGRYDTKDFSFKPVMDVPHLAFDSFAMYVDEKAAKIYVVYKDDLLRIPLHTTLPAAAN